MKKILMLGSAVMLLSTSAFASKARLEALGEDKDGSYFISDYRNIYINPAELSSLGNMAIFEWGTSGASYGNASVDPDNNPKAEGGAIYNLSNGLTFGAILGDETDVAALTRMLSSNVYGGAGAGSAATFLQTADNVVDLFVAGKGSMNWGANLLYTGSKNEQGSIGTKQHSYATRFGVSQDNWNAHALIALGAKSENTIVASRQEYKGKIGFRLGGGYDLSNENKTFAMYERYGWEQDNATDARRDGKFSKMFAGVGHTKKVSDSSSIFAKLQAEMTKIELESVGALVAAKIDRVAIPLSIGFEHSAMDWLVLRGSVVQNLWGTVKNEGLAENFGTGISGSPTTTGEILRRLAYARYGSSLTGTNGKKTLPNSTTVNAGATLSFGKLAVDGLVGATSGARNGSVSSSSGTNTGALTLDNLETRVAVSYKF